MKTDQLIAMAAKTAEEIRNRKRDETSSTPQGHDRQEPKDLVAPSMQTPLSPVQPQASRASAPPPQAPIQQAAAAQPQVQPQQAPAPKLPDAPQQQPNMPAEAAPANPVTTAAAVAASAAAAQGGTPVDGASHWQDDVPTGNHKVVSKGLVFIFGFLALFFLWAILFPISSAVVAPGKIVSAGANKLIQHPVGGVVKEILVRDGERVEPEQVILTLDPSVSRAELSRLSARQRMLSAMQARLTSAEGEGDFTNPVAVSGLQLRGTQGADVAKVATADDPLLIQQRKEFAAGRKRLAAEVDAATSLVESLKDERSGQEARLAGERKLLEFTRMEISKVGPLAREGVLPKVRLWDLEKKRLEQVTAVGNLEATVDATSQRIAEGEAKLAQLSVADQEQRSEELTKVMGEIGEIKDQILAAQVALNSTELRAPVAGTITKMTANTVGGVIRSGDPIAEIVPTTSGLITEFRVPLNKVSSVKVGQKARVVVTTFNRRTYDPIEGEVIYVSADSELDTVTQETYFLARARLQSDPDKNTGLEEIQAGMTTEVFALSKPRVFMNYVLQPITDSFSKAFRETN